MPTGQELSAKAKAPGASIAKKAVRRVIRRESSYYFVQIFACAAQDALLSLVTYVMACVIAMPWN